ncbi:MAG: winged helix DNA-binding protein, partial [Bacteroidales bacterium]|nr:winged helix DNA-binding protein [Bacteroidales bacterium]
NSDVSRIIDRLYEKGLLSREENSQDRRQKLVDITDKGLELLNTMFDCEKASDRLLSNLSLQEIETLNSLLDKIRY